MASEKLQQDVRHSWAGSDRFVPRAFVRPTQRFLRLEAAGAIVMLIAAIAALVWANSPWHEAYETLWHTHLDVTLGADLLHIDLSLVHWVNDGLMVIFFFLVGLEIKREIVHGELRDPRKAALPALAALGGMIAPAGIYMLLNSGADSFDGWGIPMATDIAFAVAVVSLVGDRIPSAARIFLLTLAIADDIGAILVIAVFYTEELSFGWLGITLAFLAAIECAKRLEIRAMPIYIVLGVAAWFSLHESGVHATLAGVAIGLMTPAWSFFDPARFADDAKRLVSAADSVHDDDVLTASEYELNHHRLEDLDRLVTETQAPLERIEHKIAPWVTYLIVPIFAFSNAGVHLTAEAVDGLFTNRVVLGVVLGLLIGKSVGITLFTILGQKLGIGVLPKGVTYRHVFGMSIVAGIGFTVALFVANLAFDPATQGDLTDRAKIGILLGSLIAGIVGFLTLRSAPEPSTPTGDEPAPSESTPALTH